MTLSTTSKAIGLVSLSQRFFNSQPRGFFSINKLLTDNRWFERGVKGSINIKLERPSLNRGGGLRHYLSPSYDVVPSSLPRHVDNHSHLGSPSCNNSHESRSGQSLTSGPEAPETREITNDLNNSVRTLTHSV